MPIRPRWSVRRSPRRDAAWPRVEALENRNLLSGIVTLAPSDDSPQAGERITWTATAVDVGATPVYQFSAAPQGGAFHVIRDFSPANSFDWAPMQEGRYEIRVTAKDGYQATETTSAVAVDEVASRVSGTQAVVTPTDNPLVALYSVPPSSAETVFVEFAVASDHPDWRNTDARAVAPGKSTNIFVAGMQPDTTYEMRHVFSDGTGSAPLYFTTGSIPSNLAIPAFTVVQPPGPGSDLDQDMIFHQRIRNTPPLIATDLAGQVTWYYDSSQSGFALTKAGQSLVPGGTLLLNGVDRYTPVPTAPNVLREIDLAGNPVRETNLAALNAQLAAMGKEPIHAFHHDVQRLSDGNTLALALTERTVDIDGVPTNFVGEMVLVLDPDFRVTWAWDAFDHLDVDRGPVLGEVVSPGSPEPTAVVPILPAVDWLHVNAVALSPADGNLILSVRHQDWVVKIDYRHGVGDGHVIWRLGAEGDFAVDSTDPDPWFSHQHDSHYIDDDTIILFDNGNTRRESDPSANSRGQVWKLDEQTMTATLVVNADLGDYSFRLGSAQRLSNGNYSFMSGSQGQAPADIGQSIEVLPDGTPIYVLQFASPEYRSFRVRTLYEGVDDALAGDPMVVESVVVNDGSAQRSMVDGITVTIGGEAVLDPGAIELRRRDGSPVDFRLDASVVGVRTVAVLTFTGAEFIGGSLADGGYTVTVRADRVRDRWGRELDGDGDGSAGGDRTADVFRLFGDSDGDRDVDLHDLELFLRTFGRKQGDPRYLAYMDFNGDGRVGVVDLLEFAQRFSLRRPPYVIGSAGAVDQGPPVARGISTSTVKSSWTARATSRSFWSPIRPALTWRDASAPESTASEKRGR